MKLSDYKAKPVHRVLVFGPPKSGKTAVVGKLAEHYNLLWFDTEDGVKTLLNPELGIPASALDHVTLVQLPDTKDYPIAAETMHKVVDWKPLSICEEHGKANCLLCKKDGKPTTELDFSKLDDSWVIVLDSMTQLSNSVMNMILRAKGATSYDVKPEWEDYSKQGGWLDRWLSIIQNSPFNVVVISHEMGIEQEDGKEKLTAIAGTKNFSRNLPRYFDHVCYTELKARKHVLGSSTTYGVNVLTGSRTGAKTESATDGNPLLSIFTGYRNYKKVS
jgi:AAA domain